MEGTNLSGCVEKRRKFGPGICGRASIKERTDNVDESENEKERRDQARQA